MELSQDWHKRTNVRLVDILSDILKEPRSPKVQKPTHGYTIAERAPEVVTAPGVYFPAKKGNVIPLESRQDGGEVSPGGQPPDWKSLFTPEMEQNFQGWYAERAKNMGLNPNPDDPRHFYDTRGAWLKGHRSITEHLPDTYKLPGHPSFSDQSIYYRPGMKAGRWEGGKYIPSEGGLSSFAPEGKQTLTTTPTEAGSTIPLVPKQEGGEVNPSLFKETSYENLGASTQQGIEAGRNTSLLKSTPIHVSPWVSNLESLEPKPLPLTSTLSLASYAPQRNADQADTDTATPPPPPPPAVTEGLNPPPFRENTRSPVFRSDQLAAYNKKYGIAQEPDLYERLKAASGAPGMTPLLSRQEGGAVSPDPLEGLSEEERKRRAELLKTAFPIESLASSRVPTVTVPKAQKVEQTPIAGTEPTKPVEGGISGNLSDINKEVLPSGETRYSIRGAEGQGGITTPKGWVRPTQEEALETLRPTLEGGAKTRREQALASLGPKPTYYDVHPEERIMDVAREETKPSIDAIQKSLDQYKNIAQGFGLSQNPKTARIQRDEALKNIPMLTEQLARLTGISAGIPEKIFGSEERVAAVEARGQGRAVSPTEFELAKGAVVEDLKRQGIDRRPTYQEILDKQAEIKRAERPVPSPTELGLIAKAGEKGPDGKPTAEAIVAQRTLDAEKKRKIDIQSGGVAVPEIGEIPPGLPGQRNEAALEGLSSSDAAVIKNLVDYKIPYPSSFALRSPQWKNIIARAALYDPSFDSTQYPVRQRLRIDFTSGTAAKNILGLNTAVGHINSLVNAQKDLANSNWVTGNAAVNLLAKYFPVTPGLVARQGTVAGVKTKFNAVKDEMAGIFKRSGATDPAIKAWADTITDPSTATPTMWKAFIDGSIELMGSRLGALQSQYETGMGKPKDFRLLSQKSREILKGIGIDANKIDPVGEQGQAGEVASRLPGETIQQYLKRTGG